MGTEWSQDEASDQSQPNHGEHKNPSSSNIGNDVVKAKDLSAEKTVKAINNLGAIIANADLPLLDRLSPENLLTQLKQGIFLNQKRQKYWVDEKGKNCFMVYARDLSIIWVDDDRYWSWYPVNDASDNNETIEVAELVKVCWLEVRGKLETKKLSPGTSYEVKIVAMVKQQASGWGTARPVNVVLELPDGRKNERKFDVTTLQPREPWGEISAGKFTTSPQNQLGQISFSLCEFSGMWKSGLVIKGVQIQPAYN